MADLRLELNTSKLEFLEIIRSTQKLDDKAEDLLKKAIADTKQKYMD